MLTDRWHINPRPVLVIGFTFGIWWFLAYAGWINRLFLPSPTTTLKAIGSLLTTENGWQDALITTYRAVIGLAASVIIAVPFGLIFGRFPDLYEFVELPVDFLRSVPSSSLFFLFILIFGIGDISKIAVVFYGCSLIMLVNTIYGAQPSREKRDRINMLRAFGASSRQIFYLAVLRDALPYIAAGIRICASLSFVLVIVTEMFLGASRGLGRRIYDFYLAYQIPEMYGAILILGLLGYAFNKLCLFFERRSAFWTTR